MLAVKVVILPDRTEREVAPGTVADLLKHLKLHRDAHLVIRRDEILTGDIRLSDSDEVEIWPVISGGAGCGAGERPASGLGAATAHGPLEPAQS